MALAGDFCSHKDRSMKAAAAVSHRDKNCEAAGVLQQGNDHPAARPRRLLSGSKGTMPEAAAWTELPSHSLQTVPDYSWKDETTDTKTRAVLAPGSGGVRGMGRATGGLLPCRRSAVCGFCPGCHTTILQQVCKASPRGQQKISGSSLCCFSQLHSVSVTAKYKVQHRMWLLELLLQTRTNSRLTGLMQSLSFWRQKVTSSDQRKLS